MAGRGRSRAGCGAQASLVLPTYNEAGNVESLVRPAIENLPGGSRVLVVDDNSPDGTGEIAERLAAELPVEVLHRVGKKGLALAYIAGFKQLLDRGAGLVLRMDAYLSNEPRPRLLALLVGEPDRGSYDQGASGVRVSTRTAVP